MSLLTYQEKRNFNSTHEPKGELKATEKQLLFVVQKHAASHLHYDFRLEMEGVLKSWAVPKGPSMNPNDKRLAVMVEDHPYGYKDFEGNIAEGNYGAGNVIIWDNGTYQPSQESDDKDEAEKQLLAGLQKGHIQFVLHGKKLKGAFDLVKLKGPQEKAWLLIKKKDEEASDEDILSQNKSVLSGLTLEKLEDENKDKTAPNTSQLKKKATTNHSEKKSINVENKDVNIPEPQLQASKVQSTKEEEELIFMEPMLANIALESFDDKAWIFEHKYDGYRTLAIIQDQVHLLSRNHLSFDQKFKPIAEELKKIKHQAVLDGEVVIENNEGRSDFQLLQNYQKTGKGTLNYYVFDLLYLDGQDIRHLPLIERKELAKMLLDNYSFDHIFFSPHTAELGKSYFENAVKTKEEGIMAKRADSPYRSGKRSNEWLKIKITQQEEAIIVGITQPKGSRNNFGALVLAQYENNELKYIGNCGTGFDEKALKELFVQFKNYFVSSSPLKEKIKVKGSIQWLKPYLVCQVKFTEWTQEGHLRHPVYLGLREDKSFEEVKKVLPLSKNAAKIEANREAIIESNINTNSNDNSNASTNPVIHLTPNDPKPMETPKFANDYSLTIGEVNLHLTNQHKIYFPEDGITKGELVQYYQEIAEIMLPYLKGRPQSLNRFPNGIHGLSFYQKDFDIDKIPNWLKTEQIYSESNDGVIDYLICNDKATLVYMANLGCIEINPWNSTIQNIENPDWMVIDLDPESIDFKEVVKAACVVKEVLDELNVASFCKTSGASGLHIFVPLGAKYNYDTVKIFAELIAHTVQVRLPETTSILRPLKQRQHKVYIDFLQNRHGQTLAAPYSVRPRPGATVSTPLEWAEVNESLSPTQFTMKNILKRIEQKGDLWKPVIGEGANLEEMMKKLTP